MPRLVKGAKWTYGWVIVGPDREITIPKEAWKEYGFKVGDEAIFTPGSKKSGGFGISNQALIDKAIKKMGGTSLKELGRSTFKEGWTVIPRELGYKFRDKLLTVRGSGYALGFIAYGLIYIEAMKYPELEIFE